jgi:hypothetical protein
MCAEQYQLFSDLTVEVGNKLFLAYERTTDEVRIIGRTRWFAREI